MIKRIPALITACFIAASTLGLGQPPQVGDVVWAQWKPNAWYHGKVTEKTPPGFRVAFDDGDQAVLSPSLIVVDKVSSAALVRVGIRVLAQWTDGRYYPGTVANVSEKGEFRIWFDDGDRRTVAVAQIRLRAATPGAFENTKIGDSVWAQWKPNAWYHGKVTAKRPIGFHVDFDDGDQADLAPSLIVPDRPPSASQVRAGTRVLARWTDGRYYPGTVSNTSTEGKYAIKFDDGDNIVDSLASLRLLVDE